MWKSPLTRICTVKWSFYRRCSVSKKICSEVTDRNYSMMTDIRSYTTCMTSGCNTTYIWLSTSKLFECDMSLWCLYFFFCKYRVQWGPKTNTGLLALSAAGRIHRGQLCTLGITKTPLVRDSVMFAFFFEKSFFYLSKL